MVPYARLIRKVFVLGDARLVVAILKIHCWPDESQRKAASGISVPAASLMLSMVPRTALNIVKVPPVPAKTALGLEMEAPEALQTRNFTGIVLPPCRL